MGRRAFAAGLAAIGVGALALRLWGIGFGLPQLYHPDEPAYVLQALAVGRGLPNGLTFANPPLFKYVLLGEYTAAYLLERMTGAAHAPAEFVEQFRQDPSGLYLLARATSAVLGAATALAAAGLGVVVGGRRVGLIAGALAAIAFLLVRDAHFGVDDTLVTLLVTLGLVACVCVLKAGRRPDYLAAGALTGLAFAAKYDGLALLAPLTLAHLLRRDRARHPELALAGAACILATLVAFPSLITEPGRVLSDIYLHLFLEARDGYDGLDPSGGYLFYARTLPIGLGWPMLLAAIGGLGLSVSRRHWPSLVVASLPTAMLLVLGSQQLYFARFLLPTLPALIVLASIALDALFARHALVGAIALVVAGAPTVVDDLRFDYLVSQTDTRTLAASWLPADARFAADALPLGPPLPVTRNVASDVSALYEGSVEEYRSRGADYLVVSSFVSDARAVDPRREQQRQAFLEALQTETPVARFSPGDVPFAYDQIYAPFDGLDRLARPGPTISIYRLTR